MWATLKRGATDAEASFLKLREEPSLESPRAAVASQLLPIPTDVILAALSQKQRAVGRFDAEIKAYKIAKHLQDLLLTHRTFSSFLLARHSRAVSHKGDRASNKENGPAFSRQRSDTIGNTPLNALMDLGEDAGAFLEHVRHGKPTLQFFLCYFAGRVLKKLPEAGVKLIVHSRFVSATLPEGTQVEIIDPYKTVASNYISSTVRMEVSVAILRSFISKPVLLQTAEAGPMLNCLE